MSVSPDTQILLLAGGPGTRLRPIVGDRPKALAEVAGRAFLDWVLMDLRRQGIRRVVLCTGFGSDAVQEHAARVHSADFDLRFSAETSPLGTGGAIRNALSEVDQPCFAVANADSWCRYDLGAFIRFHRASGCMASMVLAEVRDRSRYGSVDLENGRITAFREKNPASSGDGWINAGIYAMERDAVEAWPLRSFSLEEDVFPVMILPGLAGWPGGSEFIDIGTPESFVIAQRMFAPEKTAR